MPDINSQVTEEGRERQTEGRGVDVSVAEGRGGELGGRQEALE